jgi:hypothetical protein
MIALVSRAAIAAAMAVIAASGSGVVHSQLRAEATRLSRVQSASGRQGQVLFPELTSRDQ